MISSSAECHAGRQQQQQQHSRIGAGLGKGRSEPGDQVTAGSKTFDGSTRIETGEGLVLFCFAPQLVCYACCWVGDLSYTPVPVSPLTLASYVCCAASAQSLFFRSQATCMIGHVDSTGNDGNPDTSFQRASSGVECRGPIQAYEAHSSPPRQLRPSILLPMMLMEVTTTGHQSVAKDCPWKVLLLSRQGRRERL